MKPLKLPGFDLPEIGKFMIESQEPIDLARSSNYIELTVLQAHFSHETSARSIYKKHIFATRKLRMQYSPLHRVKQQEGDCFVVI